MGVKHDYHSHAREAGVPGTVDLSAVEGEETHYGQALYPVPSPDPNDPLQWTSFKKNMILAICALYSFFGCSALLGPAVYIGIFAEQFNVSPNTAAGLVNYPNLAYGFGSLILVPMYQKFGRRPVMLGSLVLYAAGLIGASQCTTFGALMGARIVHTFGSGVCEAIPVQLVNDVFFLHERGKKIGWYTAGLCLGSTGPLYAGYMLAGGYSWTLFFYVQFAFAVTLLILAFFFVEETKFKRVFPPVSESNSEFRNKEVLKTEGVEHLSEIETNTVVPPRKTLSQQLKPWSGVDRDAPFFLTMARSFTLLLVPSTFWVITTYGLYIGLGGLAFNFVFPIKIVAPPYNWPQNNAGLSSIATILGYLLALPLLPASDRLAARSTRKNNGIREAEMRLPVLLPAMILAPAGLILFGMAAEKNLHWIAYFMGIGMEQWAAYFYFTVTLSYAVDSHNSNLSEMLIIMNLGKQAISFGLGLEVLNWILASGYAKIIAGAFGAVLLINNLMLLVFMGFGKKIRIFMADSWLSRLHASSAVAGESH
ncbi:major facilitator superfamily domain-containing protein [Coniochaeta sp. 2T2.1]|nr:major facilitator superfamily domain-containing protein [Coniochaeta sp. 2T2.1]